MGVEDLDGSGTGAGQSQVPAEALPQAHAGAGICYGQLDQRIGYLLRRAQIAVFRDFFSTFEAYDIRPAQYSLLTIIENNPGLSQTAAAEALGIKKANFVAMIDTVEKRGLVKRVRSAADRRLYALVLTDAGKTLIAQLHVHAARHEQRIVDKIGAGEYARIFAPLRALAEMGRNPPEPTEAAD